MEVVSFIFLFILASSVQSQSFNCPYRDEAFELITGFVFTSPDSILDTRPGVLKLEDCISACQSNSTCLSVNYETGLCVLFASSAEQTPGKKSYKLSTNFMQKCIYDFCHYLNTPLACFCVH